MVTTRYSIPDLKGFWETTAPETKLLRLSKAAGVALLRSLGVKGTLKEFEALVEDVQGHALTLNLLGSYLRDAHAGDIRRRDLVKLEEADAEEQGGHAFRVMDAYERWFESEGEKGKRALAVLRLLGLFDRPAAAGCLAALLKAPAIPGLTEALVGMSEAQRNLAFTRLAAAKLLTVNRDAAGTLLALDAIRCCANTSLGNSRRSTSRPGAPPTDGSTNTSARPRRTIQKPELEDLQPLYHAVAHGCLAGMHRRRSTMFTRPASCAARNALGSTTRGNSGRSAPTWEPPPASSSNLGAVSSALTEGDQAFILNGAAYCLHALGRLTEALDPRRDGLKMTVKRETWKQAAQAASNLSELELGEVAGAVGDAEQSVTYADRSGDGFWQMAARTAHADALQAERCRRSHGRPPADRETRLPVADGRT